MASIKSSRNALQALLVEDHRELDRTFDALLDALLAELSAEAARLSTEFDDGLGVRPSREEARVPSISRWRCRERNL
jgi:hypothetical protein